jgi:DNA-binding protein WhiA
VVMTGEAKDELSRLDLTKTCCRRAEVSTLLRFAGGVRILTGRVVITADVDAGPIARRLRKAIRDIYGYPSDVHMLPGKGWPAGPRYLVQVATNGEALARRTGMLDPRGRPVRGLPAQVVAGGVCDAEAVWRAAFLAQGSLTEQGRSTVLQVGCPGPEAAMALVGAARRLGITAKAREVRGADSVTIRDPEAIGALLTRIGAPNTRIRWQEHRTRREEAPATANLSAGFGDANLRRAATAATAATARVDRALQILGDHVPEHLATTATLRLRHHHASLEELGQLADPPMTKDAVAGRIRRLLSPADRAAHETGIPDTHSALTPDMLDEN